MKISAALLLALLLSACSGGYRRGGDRYKSLSELRAAHAAGLDYSVEAYDRRSPVTVLAPHGGEIEEFTSQVARRLAGDDYNLYLFSGWLGRDSGKLHVTSTRFDDPAAVRLAASAVLGLSVHAQADRGEWVCVGGRNTEVARLAAGILEAEGFRAETPCRRLPGTSPKNIVNLPSSGGVQFELTVRLLRRLARNPEDLSKFTRAVRMAAQLYLERIQQEPQK